MTIGEKRDTAFPPAGASTFVAHRRRQLDEAAKLLAGAIRPLTRPGAADSVEVANDGDGSSPFEVPEHDLARGRRVTLDFANSLLKYVPTLDPATDGATAAGLGDDDATPQLAVATERSEQRVVLAQARPPRPPSGPSRIGPRGRRYNPPLSPGQYVRIAVLHSRIQDVRRHIIREGGRPPDFLRAGPREVRRPRQEIRALETELRILRDHLRDLRARNADRRFDGRDSQSSARARLRRNLGRPPGRDHEAHHIVPVGHPARAILRRHGIDPDGRANGMWLPRRFHRSLHDREYYRELNAAFGGVRSRSEALAALRRMRSYIASRRRRD